MSALEIIIRLTRKENQTGRRLEALDYEELLAAYRDLSVGQGQELTRYALDLGDEEAREILICLACLIPGALDGIHGELLARDRIYPAELFRGADAAARDRLFGLINSRAEPDSMMPGHGLSALAWIGDEVVQSRFREWRNSPPRWRPYLWISPEEYARDGGWELATDAGRRDLFHRECYSLCPGDGPIMEPGADLCIWCGLPLVTLFDLDLCDPRLDFLGISGERLRIASCDHCVIFTTVFTEIDGSGGSRWSNFNLRPAGRTVFYRLPVLEDPEPWLRRRAERRRMSIIGDLRRSPFEVQESVVHWLQMHVSQVGGHPMWIQDTTYPRCPHCRETMMFVAQCQPQPEPSDRVVHAFLCRACGLAATRFQAS
jgi:hypothetical protein